jgi:UDPglucose 6-dehydrogenase
MEIGIIGVGVVGGAVKYGMEKLGHDVRCHDVRMNTAIEDVIDTDVCFLCVPTPSREDGSCDTSIVENVIDSLNNINYKGIISVKSTVEPGFTTKMQSKYESIKICFVPEFLRERCAAADFMENHDICVIGTDEFDIFKIIKQVHGKYPKEFIQVSPTEAEFVKYMNNVHNAVHIILANSFYELCSELGADYNNVKTALVKRDHIPDVYMDCNSKFRGFGGMCLPKDTRAMAALCKKNNINVDFFADILKENKKYNITCYEGMRKE